MMLLPGMLPVLGRMLLVVSIRLLLYMTLLPSRMPLNGWSMLLLSQVVLIGRM